MNEVLIGRLAVSQVRNLVDVNIAELAPVNVFYGDNGAGKTSILEAIYLLSAGRSFRSHKLNPLINNLSDKCVAFADIDIPGVGFQPVGVERFKSSQQRGNIRIAGQTVSSAAVLAENLPLQVLSSDTFKLLEGAPKIRRQFMDWGVFHVEQGFHGVWKNAQRCLKQRNSLLRRGRIDPVQLQAWSQELVAAGEQLHLYREHYFSLLLPQFSTMMARLTAFDGVSLEYYRGWEKSKTLAESYFDNSQKDIDRGYTGTGHHRADLRLKCQSMMAVDMLSRGQQKLVVCAMRLAQGYLLGALRGKRCVFLVDDLPAELDRHHRKALCELLEELNCQVFLTCVDYQDVKDCWQADTDRKLFHVEHGKLSLVG